MGNDAVGAEIKTRVVGYKIKKGDFAESSPNLPMRIIVFGEANSDFQSDVDFNTKYEITSARQAATLFGAGSPLHIISRILKPVSGTGVGGIPIVVIPQAEAPGASEKIIEIVPVGTATKNGTHTVFIAGRGGIDGYFYDINIETGDGAAEISEKIADAVSAVYGTPVTATATDYLAELTSKWKGLTANDLQVSVNTNDTDIGITYTVTSVQDGAGTPSIGTALTAIGEEWSPLHINSYGAVTSVLAALEAWNGIPDPDAPTGRYASIIMRPLISLFGSTLDNPTSITDGRLLEVTNALCPAPGSAGFPFEAAANMCVLFARVAQDTPHLDVAGRFYPDMPTPTSAGSMASVDNRQSFLLKGSSTVNIVSGRYQVQDFVTTYHPVGESPAQFAYCRGLIQDFNVRYAYYLNEQLYVRDHAIAKDEDIVTVVKVVKPKTWKSRLFQMFDDLERRAIITDSEFSKDSTVVALSTTNPDRLDTDFSYKRSGFTRVLSTVALAGFNFGQVE